MTPANAEPLAGWIFGDVWVEKSLPVASIFMVTESSFLVRNEAVTFGENGANPFPFVFVFAAVKTLEVLNFTHISNLIPSNEN